MSTEIDRERMAAEAIAYGALYQAHHEIRDAVRVARGLADGTESRKAVPATEYVRERILNAGASLDIAAGAITALLSHYRETEKSRQDVPDAPDPG